MKTLRSIQTIAAALICMATVSSCLEKDLSQVPETPKAEDYFDYGTSLNSLADINYGFKNYVVVFELFEENPMIEMPDGSLMKTDKEPLYRGATNENGVFADGISLPNYLKEVYLYSDYIGTISPVKLPIVNGKITFDQPALIKANGVATRATTPSGRTYPDNMMVLGDWSTTGRPDYLSTFAIENIDKQLLYNIHNVFIQPGGAANMYDLHPEYVADNVNLEVNITKTSKVSLVMLHSTATMKNTIGYFTYPTGQKPDNASQIKPIIAYPYISTYNCNANAPGSLYTGDKVELKYWDGTKFVDEFPAGVSIGWYMIQMSYNDKNGTIIDKSKFYSIRDLNKDRTHRTLAFKDASNKIVALGFEDANSWGSKDNPLSDPKYGNFGDAVFYLEFDKDGNIDTGGIPELPDEDIKEESIYTTHFGQLAFEDQWPAKGDYDMNDVIVSYKRAIHKSVITAKVSKIVDTFVPVHNGGMKQNGFGYQLTGIAAGTIKNIKIESDGIALSQYMQGLTQEPGQDYPTIILFDDLKSVLGKTFTVTIEFTPELYTERNVTPFFPNEYWDQSYKYNLNPFIICDSGEGRGKEAHIVKFPPTKKADPSLFGTLHDSSQPDLGLYYVNKDNLPTGLHLYKVEIGTEKGTQFIVPTEKISILDMYPSFSKWATSFGKEESQWWKNPAKEYLN